MPSKQWYDDWELAVTGWDDGTARIDVTLPHNNVKQVQFFGTKDTIQLQANILDKMLCELTGTTSEERKHIDGSNPSGHAGRLG